MFVHASTCLHWLCLIIIVKLGLLVQDRSCAREFFIEIIAVNIGYF